MVTRLSSLRNIKEGVTIFHGDQREVSFRERGVIIHYQPLYPALEHLVAQEIHNFPPLK